VGDVSLLLVPTEIDCAGEKCRKTVVFVFVSSIDFDCFLYKTVFLPIKFIIFRKKEIIYATLMNHSSRNQ